MFGSGYSYWVRLRAVRVVVAAVLAVALQAVAAGIASASVRVLRGDVPSVVSSGHAAPYGHHHANAVLDVNVGLGVRDSAGLDALIAAASTPGTPQYGHYLTQPSMGRGTRRRAPTCGPSPPG